MGSSHNNNTSYDNSWFYFLSTQSRRRQSISFMSIQRKESPASAEIHLDWVRLDHMPTSKQSLPPEAGMPWWLSPAQRCILRLKGDGKGREKVINIFQSHTFPTHSSQVMLWQHPSIFSSLRAVGWIVSHKKLCWSPRLHYLEMWPYLETVFADDQTKNEVILIHPTWLASSQKKRHTGRGRFECEVMHVQAKER